LQERIPVRAGFKLLLKLCRPPHAIGQHGFAAKFVWNVISIGIILIKVIH
jgi:hypothetical protein